MRVQMNYPCIRIKHINLPATDLFSDSVFYLSERINGLTSRRNKPSAATVTKRNRAIRLVIQGLYQCYCSMNEQSALLVPLNPSSYKENDPDKIDIIGYKIMKSVVDSMLGLGWIKVRLGARYKDESYPTLLFSAGDLLLAFSSCGIRWQRLTLSKDTIILRNYDPVSKERYRIPVPKSDYVRRMHSQIKRINTFFSEHAICLLVQDHRLQEIVNRVGKYRGGWDHKSPAIINFPNVSVRRIFARSSMALGGRLYGPWWQNLKKEERVHITINGSATVEVDYSALHPSMLYHMAGLPLPDGDLYDIYDSPGYDASIEPYKSQRQLIKEFVVAKLNDLDSKYRFSKEKADALGLTGPQLLARLKARLPEVTKHFGTDIGLKLQRSDSDIAVLVIAKMMDQGYAALPIHDSFICDIMCKESLKRAMTEAYLEVMGNPINFKVKTLFDNGPSGRRIVAPEFPVLFDTAGNVDHGALYTEHTNSIHQKYQESFAYSNRAHKKS